MSDGTPGLPGDSAEAAIPEQVPAKPKRRQKRRRTWRSPMARKLMANLATGTMTGAAAARKAGYSDVAGGASVVASKALADPEFRRDLQAMMDRIGATREKVLTTLREGLDATRKTYATSEGKITDERIDPDWEVRGKFADRAARVRGDCGYSGTEDGGGMSIAVMVNIIRQQAKARGLPL